MFQVEVLGFGLTLISPNNIEPPEKCCVACEMTCVVLFVLLHTDNVAVGTHLDTRYGWGSHGAVEGEESVGESWDRRASAVFRKMCKGWRDAHDQSVTRLTINNKSLPGILMR